MAEREDKLQKWAYLGGQIAQNVLQRCQFPLFFGAEFGAVDATEGSQKLFWSCERSTDAVLTL